jgi:hypothetical protein
MSSTISFYGKRNTSCFQAQHQGHRLRGIQVHPPPVNVVHLHRPQPTGSASADVAPESTSGVASADAAPECTSRVPAHAVLQCTSSASGEAAPNTTQKGKKWSRAATVSTTDKVVHKTTKIPGPLLKPLPQRAYDQTDEEVKVISDAKVKAHFAPKVPEPKPTSNESARKTRSGLWICLLKRPNKS